jgi:hypothetical protein
MVVDRADACNERILSTRIVAEYAEMPGLSVTVAQACRLWNLDRAQCAQVLHSLVSARVLRRSGDNFVRADSGRVAA